MMPRMIFAILPIFLFSCREGDLFLTTLSSVKSEIFGETDEEEVPGAAISSHLSQTYSDQTIDISSVLEVIEIEKNDSSSVALMLQGEQEPPQATEGAIDILSATTFLKTKLTPETYIKDQNEIFTPTPVGPPSTPALRLQESATITWTAETDEFIVSPIAKMPIRNQKSRGTCSSFAGMGQLEAMLINKYQLSGIDLSEQRFYYMSKPDTWNNGGAVEKQGSNSGTGFAKSNGYSHEGVTFPPNSPADFNIPLEQSCPYNGNVGQNDVQTPQANTCYQGVVKVTDFRAWLYKWNEQPQTGQQIFDFLVARDYPVVVASGLSGNWEKNDGMITLAESGYAGQTSHAAGHAYLIIGAKKLDETLYPGEGGMCFIIRNSWGKGWGVDGHSCMTLAWFNAFKYETGFPQILDATIDEAAVTEAKLNKNYDESVLQKPLDNTSRSDTGVRRKGKATFELQNADPTDIGKPVVLVSKDGETIQFFHKILEDTIELNGLLNSNSELTKSLFLEINDNNIFLSQKPYPRYQVGSLDVTNERLLLCSGRFTEVCSLNYQQDLNELIIGLTPRQKSLKLSQPPYSWQSFELLGYGLEFSKPDGLNTQVDTRLKVKGVHTNPIRFLIDPTSSEIKYKGKAVGNLGAASLCSGEFSGACKLVLSGDKFHLFERSQND